MKVLPQILMLAQCVVATERMPPKEVFIDEPMIAQLRTENDLPESEPLRVVFNGIPMNVRPLTDWGQAAPGEPAVEEK